MAGPGGDATPSSGKDASDDSNQRARNIVQGLGSLTVQNLVTSLLGFVFLATLLHQQFLPQNQYGIYSAVLVSVNIAAAFAGFGLNLTATRYVAFLREEDQKKSWVAARKILLLSVVFAIVATSFYLASSPLLSSYFTKSQTWTWAFLIGGAWLFSVTVSNTLQAILQGLKKYTQLATILIATRLLMVVFTVGALLLQHNVGYAIGAWVLYNCLIIVWVLAMIGKDIFRTQGSFGYSGILRYSAPLGVAAIIAVLATSSDTVVVGGALSTVSLAIYSAAITISTVLSVVVLTPLTTALLPEISSTRTEEAISYGVRLSLRFAVLVILPASLFVSAVSIQLLDLFSSGGYASGAFTLQMIALFYVFLAIQSILLVLLQAVGKTVQVIIVGVVTAITDIGVAVLLVPQLGMAGAVASKIAVSLDGMLVAMYLSRQYTKKLDPASFYLRGALAAAVPFVIVFSLSYFFSSRVITLIPYAIIYSLLFLAFEKAVKLVSDDDRSFLVHVLPKSLQRFVRFL